MYGWRGPTACSLPRSGGQCHRAPQASVNSPPRCKTGMSVRPAGPGQQGTPATQTHIHHSTRTNAHVRFCRPDRQRAAQRAPPRPLFQARRRPPNHRAATRLTPQISRPMRTERVLTCPRREPVSPRGVEATRIPQPRRPGFPAGPPRASPSRRLDSPQARERTRLGLGRRERVALSGVSRRATMRHAAFTRRAKHDILEGGRHASPPFPQSLNKSTPRPVFCSPLPRLLRVPIKNPSRRKGEPLLLATSPTPTYLRPDSVLSATPRRKRKPRAGQTASHFFCPTALLFLSLFRISHSQVTCQPAVIIPLFILYNSLFVPAPARRRRCSL